MEDLTFGEQVKIVLGRKGMTIKELAETIASTPKGAFSTTTASLAFIPPFFRAIK